MFIMDVPNIPVQEPPLIAENATVAQRNAQQFDRVIGVCQLSSSDSKSEGSGLSVAAEAVRYFRKQEQYRIEGQPQVSILQMPKHGTLKNIGDGNFGYDPETGYIGNDHATLLVEVGGKKVKMEYFFRVMQTVPEAAESEPPIWEQGYCPKKARVWKISATTDGNGNNFITAVDYQSYTANISDTSSTGAGSATMDTAALTATLDSSYLDSLTASTAGITVNIADLPGGALGQTTGTSITLDNNAAGNGWFIDVTPGSNEEFLPTSNPNEWVAKAGSAAYGKMDMLSVLLHEYGHTLGIEHSADGQDYMATTLTAGVRRLPSAEELALMQQLVGEAKVALTPTLSQGERGQGGLPFPSLPLGASFGLAFLGRLRGNRYGGVSLEPDLSTLVTRFAVAANAKLSNGSFTSADGQPSVEGWSTQGSVDIANGAATLKEVATSQTRLSQVFTVNQRDRFLSFTLAGSALDDVNGAPDDAFEVALLDANTGLSLAGALSLGHTDAMLNLQANGTETAASSVTRVTNADGSFVYTAAQGYFGADSFTQATWSNTLLYLKP